MVTLRVRWLFRVAGELPRQTELDKNSQSEVDSDRWPVLPFLHVTPGL
jgi:hypothetical protein